MVKSPPAIIRILFQQPVRELEHYPRLCMRPNDDAKDGVYAARSCESFENAPYDRYRYQPS